MENVNKVLTDENQYSVNGGLTLMDEPKTDTNDTTNIAETYYDNYKMLLNMIKQMNEQYEFYKKHVYDHLKNDYSLQPSILDVMIAYSDEEIDNLPFSTALKLEEKYSINKTVGVTVEETEEEIKRMRDMYKDIKNLSLSLIKTKQESESIKAEAQEALDEYFKALESPEMIQKKREKLQKMKELVDEEQDISKKIEMKNKIKIIEESDNFSFLFKKFTDTKGAKFIKSIYEAFFIKERGNYIMDRFARRIGKFGFDEKLYKYFFNLEEKFLPEEYHPFNNLFLFVYMKYVAYADPYNNADSVYVQALTSSIANLVYHRYASNEKEKEFIEIIKRVDDYFMEYLDKFVSENTTHPKHPLRIKMDVDYEVKRKTFLIEKMKDLKIENIDESLSANELQEYMNKEIERMIEENKKEMDSEEQESSTEESIENNEEELQLTNIWKKK